MRLCPEVSTHEPGLRVRHEHEYTLCSEYGLYMLPDQINVL